MQRVDRQCLAVLDAGGTEVHVGVHGLPAPGAERRYRQQLVGRLRAVGTVDRGGVGVRADQWRQVGEAQQVRVQLAAQFRSFAASDEQQVAGEVAATDVAAEVLVVIAAGALAQPGAQVALGGVGRRIGQGDAGQRVQLGHAAAGEPQAQVERAQLQRIGQRADQGDVAVADVHVGLHRKGLAGILQRQHGTGLAFAGERTALVRAAGLPGELVAGRAGRFVPGHFRRLGGGLAGGLLRLLAGVGALLRHDVVVGNRRLQRFHGDLEPGLRDRVIQPDHAVVETDRAHVQMPCRRPGFLRWIEVPGGATVLVALQVDAGVHQLHAGYLDAMHQQRPRREPEAQRIQLREWRLRGPVGVGDADVARGELGPRHPGGGAAAAAVPAPVQREVTVDGKGPADRLADLVADERPQPVPVERGDDDQCHHEQRQHDAADHHQ